MFNTKKKHFKKMLADTQKMIWQLEFKKHKKLVSYETTRKDYDRSQQALEKINAELTTATDEQKKTDLLKNKENVEKYAENLRAQLEIIFQSIWGKPATETEPATEGVEEELEAFVELYRITEDFISKNC